MKKKIVSTNFKRMNHYMKFYLFLSIFREVWIKITKRDRLSNVMDF